MMLTGPIFGRNGMQLQGARKETGGVPIPSPAQAAKPMNLYFFQVSALEAVF